MLQISDEDNNHNDQNNIDNDDTANNITSVYYPPEEYSRNARISTEKQYESIYRTSIDYTESFWRSIAITEFYWKREPLATNFLRYNFNSKQGPIFVEWMRGALTNISYNCLDKHINAGYGDKIAYKWEGNSPHDINQICYYDLRNLVCKCANVLKRYGVKIGSNVAIYMPVTIELVATMLACARLGATHTVVFAGFSADALADRMQDAGSCILVTADGFYRGDKLINLKNIADLALKKYKEIKKCLVFSRLGLRRKTVESDGDDDNDCAITITINTNGGGVLADTISWNNDIDVDWSSAMEEASDHCGITWVDSTHPLFVLYSSGSTGKPKGIVQSTGGYMLFSATMFKYVFNYYEDDIMFCTADLGWITGHTMSVYGALCNRATCILFEGTPFYPTPSRFWQIVDRYKVTIMHSAPTVVRSLMKYDNDFVTSCSRTSLKLLGLVGEPVNADAWRWFYEIVGNSNCPIVDTYFQTETAAPMLTPLPGATPLKPGSATKAFFGVDASIVDEHGREIKEADIPGNLVFKSPWPGMLTTINGNHDRFESTYFSQDNSHPYYITGDRAKRDSSGYFWILGRADDMLNVSGHLLSTAEVEGALTEHCDVAEAAVVSYPHPIKGEALSCYVVMKNNIEYNDDIETDLKDLVRIKIGPLAIPDRIVSMKQLPKTRSGKIMRRILKKASSGDKDLGDISTMADQAALQELFPDCLHEVTSL